MSAYVLPFHTARDRLLRSPGYCLLLPRSAGEQIDRTRMWIMPDLTPQRLVHLDPRDLPEAL